MGGLVGKTLEIDEATRIKPEFVRLRIACRDIYEVPSSAERNLGLNIFDFFYELEEPEHLKKEAQKTPVMVPDNEPQPQTKKMRIEAGQAIPGNTNRTPFPTGAPQKGDDKGIQSVSMSDLPTTNLSFSAPGKMNYSKKTEVHSVPFTCVDLQENQEEHEAIPAATYQPDKDVSEEEGNESSDDFEREVNKILESDEVQSNPRTCVWMLNQQQIPISKAENVHPDLLKNIIPDTIEKSNEGGDLDFTKIINPCEILQQQRDERRWSQRIQAQSKVESKDGPPETKANNFEKRPLSGNPIPTYNSFSVLIILFPDQVYQ